VFRHEGGFVNDPVDRGGATNMGITLNTLRQAQPGATVQDLRNMTRQQARSIYRQRYVQAPGLDHLPPGILPQVIDMSVNHGPRNAVRILQRALNRLNQGTPVVPDGHLGPGTLAAVQRATQGGTDRLTNAIADERQAFYDRIIERDPRQARFERGWRGRTNDFRVPANGGMQVMP
jgi:lysozyme family protein